LLQPLVDALSNVRRQGEETVVSEEFGLKALIGEQRLGRYYRYDGSLTTPPCFESVIWTVLLEPLKLSYQQLQAFRYLHDHKAKPIENTYRPVQPLGSRILFRSFLSENAHEDQKLRTKTAENNNGQNLKNNMKLIVVLSSLLMIIAL
jgi:carbonic anhydrase